MIKSLFSFFVQKIIKKVLIYYKTLNLINFIMKKQPKSDNIIIDNIM